MALTYDPQAPRLSSTTLGGVTDSRTYDSFGQLATYTAKYSGTTLYDVSYVRDALGRIRQKTETIQGDTKTTEYGYDQIGRLITVAENGATVRDYVYDDNGNRTEFDDVEHGTTTLGTYDAQDRMLTYGTLAYTYTADGALASKTDTATGEVTAYAYDALGNLTRVDLPDGRVIEYVIDGMGRRVGKKINGVMVKGWLYADGLRPVAELDGSGAIVGKFVYANRPNVPEYVIKGGVAYRFVLDRLGSPKLVVDAATGTVAERVDRDELGNVASDTSPGFHLFGFAGGMLDQDTGLIRFEARDYDPAVGRWTGKDPSFFAGRDTNLYDYVDGDPVNRVDPSGKRYWTEAEVQSLLNEGVANYDYNPSTASSLCDALVKNGTRRDTPGAYDFRMQTPFDWFYVGNLGVWLNAGQFGNYFAGYVNYGAFGPVGTEGSELGGDFFSVQEYLNSKNPEDTFWDSPEDRELIERGAFDYASTHNAWGGGSCSGTQCTP